MGDYDFKNSTGIFWVYFRDGANQLKLQVEAEGREKAIKAATSKALLMNSVCKWQFDDCQACR